MILQEKLTHQPPWSHHPANVKPVKPPLESSVRLASPLIVASLTCLAGILFEYGIASHHEDRNFGERGGWREEGGSGETSFSWGRLG